MTDIDVAKLARLSRIAVSDEELEELAREVPAILAFVEQIAQAGGTVSKDVGAHYNVLRDDAESHERGLYTKEMLRAMPNTKDGYLRVRKVISQD